MSQPSQPSQPEDPQHNVRHLLYKAVKGLPEEEQEAVFLYFFELGIGAPPTAFLGPPIPAGAEMRRRAAAWHEPGALATVFAGPKPIGPDQIMIPVRLSEAQHRRLKEWCAEHNFPMAVVVRGLIDRFLDSFDKRAA